jgi:hypothetical protein
VLAALISALQRAEPAESKREDLVKFFADKLRPHPTPPSALHEILHEAAQKAGWTLPSPQLESRQRKAAQGRKVQREEDLAHRRVLVAAIFKGLSPKHRAAPASTATAQAIIGKLEKLPFDRRPPVTIRTIQEDLRFLRANGNWGI